MHLLGHALVALQQEPEAFSTWREALRLASADELVGLTIRSYLQDTDH